MGNSQYCAFWRSSVNALSSRIAGTYYDGGIIKSVPPYCAWTGGQCNIGKKGSSGGRDANQINLSTDPELPEKLSAKISMIGRKTGAFAFEVLSVDEGDRHCYHEPLAIEASGEYVVIP